MISPVSRSCPFESDNCDNDKLILIVEVYCMRYWLQASKGDNWDKTKANDAAQASADRSQKKSGDILEPVLINP